jgi:hypothetical protein
MSEIKVHPWFTKTICTLADAAAEFQLRKLRLDAIAEQKRLEKEAIRTEIIAQRR